MVVFCVVFVFCLCELGVAVFVLVLLFVVVEGCFCVVLVFVLWIFYDPCKYKRLNPLIILFTIFSLKCYYSVIWFKITQCGPKISL